MKIEWTDPPSGGLILKLTPSDNVQYSNTKLLELGIYVSMSMAYLEKNCDFKIIYIYIYIYNV
jgi:hypothetical protein